jgi:DNA-directed RNA polymerase subunit beta'
VTCRPSWTSRGRRLSLSRNGELAIIDDEGRERAVHRLPYGAVILFANGAKVKKGDRIAEWDPFTMPVITEKPGVVKYQDLIDGKTLTEQVDEATGIAQRVVTEHRASARKKEDLRPRLTLLDDESGRGGALHARHRRDALGRGWAARLQRATFSPVSAAKPPRPATSPAVCRALPSCSKRASPRTMRSSPRFRAASSSSKDYKAKRKIAIQPEDGGEAIEYLIPKSKVIDVQEGDYVKRGDNLIGGSPDPHDILEVLGIEALAEYLVA